MHELADGWAMSNLGSLADVAIGGTPSRDIARFWAAGSEDGYPWVSIADLRGRVVNRTKETITAAGVTNSNVKLVKRGTVLMSFKLSLGRMAYAGCDLFTNEAIAAFLVNEKIRSDYLFYCLPNSVRLAATDVAIKGATLNKESLKKLRIPYPSRDIQRKIVAILTSIDTAIEKTEALIAKYQQIKAGLMHDLFTRGVLPNGQLRPPREQAPELYQETAIGWIPRGWRLANLRSCLRENPTNGIYKSADQIGEGNLMVGQTAFTTERSVDFALCRRGLVDANDLRRYGLAKDDILVTRVFATVQGVGLPTLVPDLSEPAVFESNMMRLKVDSATVLPRLLFEWLRGQQARRFIHGGANASNQSSVNQGVLNPLPIPLPNITEQSLLAKRIEGLDQRYAIEHAGLEKLRRQKLGLMQDLLTGKVQVKVSEPSQEPLHA